MSKKNRKRGPYEKKSTAVCMWCNDPFEVVHALATTCSGACRGRLYRFRTKTGLEPEYPPGKVSVNQAVAELVAELLARERQRRMGERYLNSLPTWKRPAGT